MIDQFVKTLERSIEKSYSWSQEIEKNYYKDLVRERTAKTVLSYFGILMGLKLAQPFRTTYEVYKIAKASPSPINAYLHMTSVNMALGSIVSIAFTPLFLISAVVETVLGVSKAKLESQKI